MITLERVKPTEPAILEMVRNHYSHRDNVEKRPRTEKTGKTWWSNARLVVFSDPERTLVFAWQWPKPGMRADGQEGFNNTLFHRSDRCTYLASDIVLAAEQAVIKHWGSNRAYTYVDPGKIKSSNPGFCYKMAGWTQVKISKSGKPLLEKFLGDDNYQEKRMNYKLVLKTYAQLRQLTDDETALLNTLRGMSESERELLAETLGPPVKSSKSTKPATKRVIEKCATEGCGLTRRAQVHKDANVDGYHEFLAQTNVPAQPAKSRHASSLAGAIKKKSSDKEPRCVACYEIATHSNHDLDNGGHEFTTDLAGRVNAVLDKSSPPPSDDEERCTATREGGRICNLLVDHNVHQMTTTMGYHEFVGGETAVGVGG